VGEYSSQAEAEAVAKQLRSALDAELMSSASVRVIQTKRVQREAKTEELEKATKPGSWDRLIKSKPDWGHGPDGGGGVSGAQQDGSGGNAGPGNAAPASRTGSGQTDPDDGVTTIRDKEGKRYPADGSAPAASGTKPPAGAGNAAPEKSAGNRPPESSGKLVDTGSSPENSSGTSNLSIRDIVQRLRATQQAGAAANRSSGAGSSTLTPAAIFFSSSEDFFESSSKSAAPVVSRRIRIIRDEQEVMRIDYDASGARIDGKSRAAGDDAVQSIVALAKEAKETRARELGAKKMVMIEDGPASPKAPTVNPKDDGKKPSADKAAQAAELKNQIAKYTQLLEKLRAGEKEVTDDVNSGRVKVFESFADAKAAIDSGQLQRSQRFVVRAQFNQLKAEIRSKRTEYEAKLGAAQRALEVLNIE